ncbi:choice-of-anchor D domain-containing protein [Anaeromyxobacter terrae]|uniref:choice-of-anchor D domain-containing protein n=1 Tax=Anaeromyxobacter terrae TaxID=2925406 RepID=UPI001F5809D5|nr:choice-of-anchor D domain-containing protein [Anaeromyxobacter sp. SG22]
MNKFALAAVAASTVFAGLVLGAGRAHAYSGYYTDRTILGVGKSCADCHGATSTCNGCHAHGTHGTNAKDSINIVATTDKSTYAPGETVTVTVNGGYRNGWLRVALFDQSGTRLATASNAQYPVALTAPAPTTGGTVSWRAAWYGNQYDIGFPSIASGTFGSGSSATIQPGFFTPDSTPGAPHGWQAVAVPAFTVQAPAAPAISLSPTSLAFGTVTVGASSTLTTQVRNTGNAALSVTGIAPCAGTPAVFGWSPTTPISVAAGSSANVNVTFTPTSAGALPAGACLVFSSNDPAKPTVNLGVNGSGAAAPAPAIALNPTSLAFGTVTVGTSKALATQIQNTGNAPLNVTGVAPCPGTPAVFTWTPATPIAVAAGGSTSLTVTFAPTTAAALPAGACLAVTSDDPARPTVNLGVSGTGAAAPAPGIVLSPTSLAFGTVTVGTSKTLAAQVQNTGNAPLNVTGIASCAGTPAVFAWTPVAPFTVPAGGATALNVTFTPTSTGSLPAGACLAIASDDPAHASVNLGVTGTAAATPAPAIALSPTALAFGTVTVGTSKSLTTQIQNTGNAPLNVTGVAPCAGTPAVFTWAPATPVAVAAGASTTLTVTFGPTSAGALPSGACLAVSSDDPARPTVDLNVSGAGATVTAPAIALDPTSLAFGSVTVGTTKTLSTTLRNTGNAPLNVTSIARCNKTSAAITWSPAAPLTIEAGASTTLDVTFAPTSAGALANNACLAVSSDDPANPTVALGLSGTGTTQATPAIALSPASVVFGSVTVGASRTVAVQVQNTGTATLDVISIARCAGTSADVTWTLSTPASVAPGGSATFDVTYAPAAEGSLPAGACLAIASNDPVASTVNLGLAGTGATTPVPSIALAPATVDFGAVTVGTSKTLSVKTENTGNGALTVSSVSLCAGTPAVLTWTPAALSAIAGGASATLDVTYAPTSAGALPAGACLVLASDDPAQPTITLAVSGSGAAPAPGQSRGGCGCNTGGPADGVLAGVVLLLLVAFRARGAAAHCVAGHGAPDERAG